MVDDLWVLRIEDRKGWKSAVLDPDKWWEMTTWRKENERAPEVSRNKREAENADGSPLCWV